MPAFFQFHCSGLATDGGVDDQMPGIQQSNRPKERHPIDHVVEQAEAEHGIECLTEFG